MSTQVIVLPERDRRSRRSLNRFRRFINDYWILPLLFCYLQLATQVVYPADAPLQRIAKGYNSFIDGIPIAYNIATQDFPYTLIGHLYEIGLYGFYKSDLLQVSHDDIRAALSSPDIQKQIYRRMIASRDHHESEIGGIVTISYSIEGVALHFHELTSLNEQFLLKLRENKNLPSKFVDLISLKENQEIFDSVGIETRWREDIRSLIQHQGVTENNRRLAMENFVEMFEALSESRYLLSPYQLKQGLGKIPFNQRIVGLFHFHNGLNEPPSPVDIQQSMRKRQIVLTFSEAGFTVYDLAKRKLLKIDIKIDKPAML